MVPRVTVLITAYRRQTYLMDAVHSVLSSPVGREAYEIVLAIDQIDDALASSLRALGVNVLEVASTGGGEMTVAGLRAARGEVVAFLDDDDCFLPGKLARVLEVFEDPDVLWYRHGFRRVDEDRQPLSTEVPARREPRVFWAPLSREELGRIRHAGGFYNSSCHTVRRSALLANFDSFLHVTFSQDWAIPTLASGRGKVILDMTNILSEYRTHWSLDSHPFSGDVIPEAHLQKLRGIVREFCWLSRVAPSAGARTFAQCRADSYEAILWTTRRESIQDPRSALFRSLHAILGNVEEGDLFHAGVLLLLVANSFLSSRFTEAVYTALKRVEMRSHGLDLPD